MEGSPIEAGVIKVVGDKDLMFLGRLENHTSQKYPPVGKKSEMFIQPFSRPVG